MATIYCTKCKRQRPARHAHGIAKNRKGPRRCWNECGVCGELYSTTSCAVLHGKAVQKAQLRLEKSGQLRLF
jgi:methionyl-tRNA synthetase